MNDKDFLKGMIAYKIISDSKNNSGGGKPGGGGCSTVILIVGLVLIIAVLAGSCGSGKKTSSYSYSATSSRSSTACAVSGCPYRKMKGSPYCPGHTCAKPGCYAKVYDGGYCYIHQPITTTAARTTKPSSTKPASTKPSTRSTEKKDPYNISGYDDIDDFYDDWYDDFDGFDDAEMYWDDHH